MTKFPVDSIKPLQGVLRGLIFENAFVNIPQNLFFSVEIPLEPMSLTDFDDSAKEHNTSIVLDWIKLDIRTLTDIENNTFTFPINPEKGHIDGSMYLFDCHNPVDATVLKFGTFKNQEIELDIAFKIDFEYEGTGFQTTDFLTIKTKLHLDKMLIAMDILSPVESNLYAAETLMGQFIDHEKFDKPQLTEMGIASTMKV